VAVTRDNTDTIRLHVDGKQEAVTTTTANTTPTSDKGGFRLGHDAAYPSRCLRGVMDEAGVANDALPVTDFEIMFRVGATRARS
jgi:hypothetical protein